MSAGRGIGRKRARRSKEDQVKALESVLYEMLILASALLLRDKRGSFRDYPRLLWGPPQIAHDVIRLKCRVLLDFFFPREAQPDDDMTVLDFGDLASAPLGQDGIEELRAFTKRINKWTAHLSWTRTTEPEYSKKDRQLMEGHATKLLGIASKFIEDCMANGGQLHGRAKAHHDNFARVHAYLVESPRVEEGKEKLPVLEKRIDLEQL
jgi:hypothetical protein